MSLATALLAVPAAAFWVFLLLGSGLFDPANAVTEQAWDLLLEAKIEDLARAAGGAADAPAGGVTDGGATNGAADDGAERAAAVDALLADWRALPPPTDREQRARRETGLRVALLLGIGGRLTDAAEVAAESGAAPLGAALRAVAEETADDPLAPADVEEAVAAAPPGGWQRARLGLLLAEAVGTPDARAEASARYQGAVDRLAGTGVLLGGTVALAGLAGLGLLGFAPWRLRHWLALAPRAATPFQGGAPVAVLTVLAWFLAHVAATTALALLLGLGGGDLERPLPLALLLAGGSLVTGLAGLTLIRLLAAPERLLSALGFDRAPDGRALRAALAGVAAAVPLVVGASLLNRWLVGPQGLPPALTLLASDPGPVAFGLLVVATVGLAPVFEEAVFRGYLYPALRTRLGIAAGAAASGAAFAVVHVQPGNLLPLFALGVLFSLVREATGTLWAPVLSHALWNLGSLAMAGFVFG